MLDLQKYGFFYLNKWKYFFLVSGSLGFWFKQGFRRVIVDMCSYGIKKFQMERQVWERNWIFSVLMGIGYRNSEKDLEGFVGQGGVGVFDLSYLKKFFFGNIQFVF